jgi:NAD(P)-dependent dehydrogenase (short-subunit alcohol dehydrogenase family)
MKPMTGKTVLITGGTGGIGKAVFLRLRDQLADCGSSAPIWSASQSARDDRLRDGVADS